MNSLRLRHGHELVYLERGRGKPLLLLHGFTGSSLAWGEGLLEKLAKTRRIIAPDLLGHGKSSRPLQPARYRLEAQVEDICELLHGLGAERASWLGYSMGGRLALTAAHTAADRVHDLLLVGASPGLRRSAERTARRQLDEAMARDLEESGIESFVDFWMQSPLFANEHKLGATHLSQQRTRRLANDPFALAASLRGAGSGTQTNLWPELTSISARTLLLTGALDTKFCAIASRMNRQLPNSSHTVIDEAGHAVQLEKPGEFAQVVLQFLHEGDA